MQELWLLRHAEAMPAAYGTSDRERPLSAHGEQQARDLGAWLATHELRPDHVLCSSALRTRNTLAHILVALPLPLPVHYLDAIYGATPGQLLALLDQHARGERVLLVGHNPGLAYLVTTLCSELADGRGMGPATLARIALDGPAEPGRGRLLAWRPGA